MNDESVDAILKCYVVIKFELTLILNIASDVDSRAINDMALVPFTVMARASTSMLWHVKDEEGHEIAVSVNDITINDVLARTEGFSEDDCAWSVRCPPGVSIDDVLTDSDVVRSVSSDSRSSEMVDVISCHIDTLRILNCDTSS